MHVQNDSETIVDASTRTSIEPPKRYYIVMHNDDSTPIDFVVKVLIELYRHEDQTAADLANKIHIDEKAIVGILSPLQFCGYLFHFFIHLLMIKKKNLQCCFGVMAGDISCHQQKEKLFV